MQKHEEFVTANKDVERKLEELGGMKWLYAHTYCIKDQFWENYDAESLPTVYEKVKVDVEAEKKAAVENKSLLWPLIFKNVGDSPERFPS
jgi:delta24-sterol reductase